MSSSEENITADASSVLATPSTATARTYKNDEEILAFILDDLCHLDTDSQIRLAFENFGISDVNLLMGLSDETIASLKYNVQEGKRNISTPIIYGAQHIIRQARDYALYIYSSYPPPDFFIVWGVDATKEDFSRFVKEKIAQNITMAGPASNAPSGQIGTPKPPPPAASQPTPPPPSVAQTPTATQGARGSPPQQVTSARAGFLSPMRSTTPSTMNPTTLRSSARDPVGEFRKASKRDKNNYIPLKDEKTWPTFKRKLRIQAFADGIQNQLDKDYVPNTAEEQALDQVQSHYFFSVLEHVLLTDRGKTIVRKHLETFNARAAYAELVIAMTRSTKAKHKKEDLMKYLVTSKFGLNVVDTTAEHFILTFQAKFRELDELQEQEERYPLSARLQLLQAAVHPIEELRRIETDLDITGTDKDFYEYCTLLESAAVTYDKAKRGTSRRRVNHHDSFFPDSTPGEVMDVPPDDQDFID